MPVARWTTLCAALTWKMFNSIPSGAMAGTKPRMPMTINTIPKITAIDLTMWNLLLVGRTTLMTVVPHLGKLENYVPVLPISPWSRNEKAAAVSKIDNHEENPTPCSAVRRRRAPCRSQPWPGCARSHNQNRDLRRRLLLVHSTGIRQGEGRDQDHGRLLWRNGTESHL